MYVPSFEEYVRLCNEGKINEGIGKKIAPLVGGALLAGGLNAANPGGNPDDEKNKYNFAPSTEYREVDTLPPDYSVRNLKDYQKNRAHNNYKDYVKYEDDHTHRVPFFLYDKYDKRIEPYAAYTGRYQTKGDAFAVFKDNGFLNLYPSTPKARAIMANLIDSYENNTVPQDDPYFTFKLIKKSPKTKDGVLINDGLGMSFYVKDIDKFLKFLYDEHYIVRKAGDTIKKTDDQLFKNGDMTEFFNIVPQGNARRTSVSKPDTSMLK